jgi:hypothetical protein
MIRKLKARIEAKDAASRQPYGVKVHPAQRLSTGGTDWGARSGVPGALGESFLHMNTDQFMEHLGPREEPPT